MPLASVRAMRSNPARSRVLATDGNTKAWALSDGGRELAQALSEALSCGDGAVTMTIFQDADGGVAREDDDVYVGLDVSKDAHVDVLDRVEMLVELVDVHGAPVEMGNTVTQPLHLAAQQNRLPIVQALLQRGANPTLRDGEADSIVKRNTPRDLTTDVHVRNCLLEAEIGIGVIGARNERRWHLTIVLNTKPG